MELDTSYATLLYLVLGERLVFVVNRWLRSYGLQRSLDLER